MGDYGGKLSGGRDFIGEDIRIVVFDFIPGINSFGQADGTAVLSKRGTSPADVNRGILFSGRNVDREGNAAAGESGV